MEKNQVFINYTGTITNIGKKTKVTDKFWKQELWINCDFSSEKYPDHRVIGFQAVNSKMKLLDGLSVGQDVNIGFKINCREYNGTMFTSLSLMSVDGKYKVDGEQNYGKGSGKQQSAFEDPGFFEENNDMPF